MATVTETRPASKPTRKPLTVELVLTINGQSYHVEPIAHAPGGLKSFRLAKVGGDSAVYDVDAHADRIVCACPSYRKSHEGTSSLCKHSRALVMVGLVDHPAGDGAGAVDLPAPRGPAAPAFDVADIRFASRVTHRVAPGVWKVVAAGAGSPTVRVRELAANGSIVGPVQVWDRSVVGAIVADLPAPVPSETPAELARAAYDAREAEADAEAPCCPADEPATCQACITPPPADEPARALTDAFLGTDDEQWTVTGPTALADLGFAAWIEREAQTYAALRTPRAAWLAVKIAALAEQARFLDAAGPDEFEDRLEAQADAARDAAEARMASRCG